MEPRQTQSAVLSVLETCLMKPSFLNSRRKFRSPWFHSHLWFHFPLLEVTSCLPTHSVFVPLLYFGFSGGCGSCSCRGSHSHPMSSQVSPSLTSLSIAAKPCGVFKPLELSNETSVRVVCCERKGSIFWFCNSYLPEAKRKWKFLFTLLWETPTFSSHLFLKGPALVPSGVRGIPWPCGTGFREELLPFVYKLGGFSFPRAVADWDRSYLWKCSRQYFFKDLTCVMKNIVGYYQKMNKQNMYISMTWKIRHSTAIHIICRYIILPLDILLPFLLLEILVGFYAYSIKEWKVTITDFDYYIYIYKQN